MPKRKESESESSDSSESSSNSSDSSGSSSSSSSDEKSKNASASHKHGKGGDKKSKFSEQKDSKSEHQQRHKAKVYGSPIRGRNRRSPVVSTSQRGRGNFYQRREKNYPSDLRNKSPSEVEYNEWDSRERGGPGWRRDDERRDEHFGARRKIPQEKDRHFEGSSDTRDQRWGSPSRFKRYASPPPHGWSRHPRRGQFVPFRGARGGRHMWHDNRFQSTGFQSYRSDEIYSKQSHFSPEKRIKPLFDDYPPPRRRNFDRNSNFSDRWVDDRDFAYSHDPQIYHHGSEIEGPRGTTPPVLRELREEILNPQRWDENDDEIPHGGRHRDEWTSYRYKEKSERPDKYKQKPVKESREIVIGKDRDDLREITERKHKSKRSKRSPDEKSSAAERSSGKRSSSKKLRHERNIKSSSPNDNENRKIISRNSLSPDARERSSYEKERTPEKEHSSYEKERTRSESPKLMSLNETDVSLSHSRSVNEKSQPDERAHSVESNKSDTLPVSVEEKKKKRHVKQLHLKKALKESVTKPPSLQGPEGDGSLPTKRAISPITAPKEKSSPHDVEIKERVIRRPESGEVTSSDDESTLKKTVRSTVKMYVPPGRVGMQPGAIRRQVGRHNDYEAELRSYKRDRQRERERQMMSIEADNSSYKEESEKLKSAVDVTKKDTSNLTLKTGGAYIPPAKLREMQAHITDKSSIEYQRIAWEALKKSIHGLVNKVNTSNLVEVVKELLRENIVRGQGLLCRSVITAQALSPTFTNVYAALLAIVNTKFPQIGELLLRRVVLRFRRGYKRQDKSMCTSSIQFIAHLINQQVAHELLALEILTVILDEATDDSVEMAVEFLKHCGSKLTEVSLRALNAIFDRMRSLLHEEKISRRVQYMIEVMFAIRKDKFKDFPTVNEDLDLVDEKEQFTHLMSLNDQLDSQDTLDIFKFDEQYEANEEKFKLLCQQMLGESSSAESGSSGEEDESEDSQDEEAKQTIIDTTETNLVVLRRTIYLTIQSSLDFEECAHKILKLELKPGQEVELCNMVLDCCAQLRTYEKFYGLLAQRFCQIDNKFVEPVQKMFKEQYETIHRLETDKLRNVARFFAHLLYTEAISWEVLSICKLTEEDTTSASRIFLKILFQELSSFMGVPKLNERLQDPTQQVFFENLLPHDNPKNTRFAINFFTTIGLGGLTDELRDHLTRATQKLQEQKAAAAAAVEATNEASAEADKPSSSDSDSESDDSSHEDSSSDSSSSKDESATVKRKWKKGEKKNGRSKDDGRQDKKKSANDNDNSDKSSSSSDEEKSKKRKSKREYGQNFEIKKKRVFEEKRRDDYKDHGRDHYGDEPRSKGYRDFNQNRRRSNWHRGDHFDNRDFQRRRNFSYDNRLDSRNRPTINESAYSRDIYRGRGGFRGRRPRFMRR